MLGQKDVMPKKKKKKRCDARGMQLAIDSLKMEERSQEPRNVCGLRKLGAVIIERFVRKWESQF